MSESPATELTFDDPEAYRRLCGAQHANLRVLRDAIGVDVQARGNALLLRGADHEVELAADVLSQLYELIRQGHPIYPNDVQRGLDAVAGGGKLSEVFLDTILVPSGKQRIAPKNLSQKRYIDAIRAHDLTFGIGPAGTGKTYLAMALAVSELLSHKVERIILTRPAVEAGERLGFLPGDLAEKVNPYLRPLYDALYTMLDLRRVQRLIEENTLEVAPLAFMRGRTLNDCFVVLDEAQNATRDQMKMFLTRLGFHARAVVTGDITQSDLPRGEESGLVHARRILSDLDEIAFCTFETEDVVRHPLVTRILRAYEADEEQRIQRSRGGREARSRVARATGDGGDDDEPSPEESRAGEPGPSHATDAGDGDG